LLFLATFYLFPICHFITHTSFARLLDRSFSLAVILRLYLLNATAVALPMGSAEPPTPHSVVFDQITASCIQSATLHTQSAAGPSGHCCLVNCVTLLPSSKKAMHHFC